MCDVTGEPAVRGHRARSVGHRGKGEGHWGWTEGHRGKAEGHRGKAEGYRGRVERCKGKAEGRRGKAEGHWGRMEGWGCRRAQREGERQGWEGWLEEGRQERRGGRPRAGRAGPEDEGQWRNARSPALNQHISSSCRESSRWFKTLENFVGVGRGGRVACSDQHRNKGRIRLVASYKLLVPSNNDSCEVPSNRARRSQAARGKRKDGSLSNVQEPSQSPPPPTDLA